MTAAIVHVGRCPRRGDQPQPGSLPYCSWCGGTVPPQPVEEIPEAS